MRASIRWDAPPYAMAQRAEGYIDQLLEAVYLIGSSEADRIADDARSSAPWTDRTGNARRGIRGYAIRTPNGVRIYVAHGVHYGIYLERRWGGKYAAVTPALQRNYAQVMARMQALVGG